MRSPTLGLALGTYFGRVGRKKFLTFFWLRIEIQWKVPWVDSIKCKNSIDLFKN